MENTKKCTKCGKELPLDQFYSLKLIKGVVRRESWCRPCKATYTSEWRKKNPGHRNLYERSRKASDVSYRLKQNIRSYVSSSLKNNKKIGHIEELLGCSIECLHNYLEARFWPGMSWDNYGEWHLDHIIPLSQFDLSDPEQQELAWHYTNLQPLWARDNLKKGNKRQEG